LLLAFFCVLQVVVFLTAGREGKRRRKQGRSARFRHQRRRVAPRAVTVPALLLRFQKWFLAISEVLKTVFVNFKLFDVIFIYFGIL
jgi:hypothetical protein